jgi:prepilin signal peptidase PulO-like enzyme (type II secretory pathway)
MRASHLLLYGLSALVIGISAWLFAPAGTFILSVLMGWTLLALAIIDWKYFILPDPLTGLLATFAIAMIWLVAREDWPAHFIGGLAGYLVLLAVEMFYRHARGLDALGRGDAKLAGALGLWLGWQLLPLLFLIAAGTGLIAVFQYGVIARQKLTTRHQIAFGPWIALAGWICWLAAPVLTLT